MTATEMTQSLMTHTLAAVLAAAVLMTVTMSVELAVKTLRAKTAARRLLLSRAARDPTFARKLDSFAAAANLSWTDRARLVRLIETSIEDLSPGDRHLIEAGLRQASAAGVDRFAIGLLPGRTAG